MDLLIQDLLAYSRLSRGELRPEPLRLADVVREALQGLDADIRARSATVEVVEPLGRVAAHWRNVTESRLVEQGDHQLYERRRLHTTRTVFGMVRIDGDLDPETGETLITALRAAVDGDVRSNGPGEPRTPAQRRADALGEICRQWLDRFKQSDPDNALARLRTAEVPVIARIHEGVVLLDPRTIADDEIEAAAATARAALKRVLGSIEHE